jgi:hypothetical protein
MTRNNEELLVLPEAVPQDAEKEKIDIDAKDDSSLDRKDGHDVEKLPESDEEFAKLDDLDRLDNDKVLETAEDFSVALVSLQDDPTLPINTFRMWFCGIGFAGFGSVLGMLFVSSSPMIRYHSPSNVGLSYSNSGPKLSLSPLCSYRSSFGSLARPWRRSSLVQVTHGTGIIGSGIS